MSARARRPTDEVATKVLEPAPHGAGPGPGRPGAAPPDAFVSFEQDPTEVTPLPGRAQIERSTPTAIDPPPAPPRAVGRPERSEPIRVVSMKDQLDAAHRHAAEPTGPRRVQLRSLGEVADRHDTPLRLGNLAPPRDPREVRARRVRSNLVRAGVAVAIAAAIAVAIWLIAGR